MRRSIGPPLGSLARIVFAVIFVSACGGRRPPGTPTPQPLALTCPQRIDATANDGIEAGVSFDATAQGGTPPVAVECSPAAGGFPVGETHVTCRATDAASQNTTCDFLVVVVVPPKLAVTRFDAFGDSITEGKISLTPTLLANLAFPDAYPAKLEALLRDRYSAQTITVNNQGVGGETLAKGRKRLPGVIDADHPDVVLLLEGVNNIKAVTTDQLADDLDSMVVTARRRGVQVVLATLLPAGNALEAKSPGTRAAIVAFNGQIHRIADKYRQGPVVDLFSAFSASSTLIGADGLHPTAEGYTRMAEIFFDTIRSRYEEMTDPQPAAVHRIAAPLPWSRPVSASRAPIRVPVRAIK